MEANSEFDALTRQAAEAGDAAQNRPATAATNGAPKRTLMIVASSKRACAMAQGPVRNWETVVRPGVSIGALGAELSLATVARAMHDPPNGADAHELPPIAEMRNARAKPVTPMTVAFDLGRLRPAELIQVVHGSPKRQQGMVSNTLACAAGSNHKMAPTTSLTRSAPS